MIEWFRKIKDDWVWNDPVARFGYVMICGACAGLMGMAYVAVTQNPLPDVTAMEWALSDRMGMDCTCKKWK